MEDFNSELNDISKRMKGAISSLKVDFLTLRTGRASSSMLDAVSVDIYGTKMALNQCASITVPEPRMIQLNVWDTSNISLVEKAIMSSGLGLNPQTEGNLIRLIIPELNEERRTELTNIPHQGITHESFNTLVKHLNYWNKFINALGYKNRKLEEIPTEVGKKFEKTAFCIVFSLRSPP